MTIVEFLEARIAEDEEISAPDPDWDDYKGHCDAAGVHYTSERVRAECAAKRALIKAGEALEESRLSADVWSMNSPDDVIARILAVVYKDHADYDPRWKA